MTKPPARPNRVLDPIQVAAAFSRVRDAHQTEVAEDYVELVSDLIAAKGEARSVDLAECLGISPATVNKTVARLQRDGYLTAERYRSIFLTEKGEHLAEAMRERHRIVFDFLCAIGVSEETAELDAEGLEHHVSEETLRCFQAIIASRSRR